MEKNKVLIVEDEPDHAKLATKLLEHCGYEVVWKDDPKDAIKVYKEEEFSLCLLDMMLPGMNGDELIKKLHEVPKENKPAVLAVTAQAVEGTKEKLLAAGFDGYIFKPFKVEEFMEVVKKYMAR